MKLGKLDTWIEILREEETGRDPFNVPIIEWRTVHEGWAQRVQMNGREFLSADAIQATQRVVFRAHWFAGVLATDRVRVQGQEHNIHEVRPLGRERFMELHTVAGAS